MTHLLTVDTFFLTWSLMCASTAVKTYTLDSALVLRVTILSTVVANQRVGYELSDLIHHIVKFQLSRTLGLAESEKKSRGVYGTLGFSVLSSETLNRNYPKLLEPSTHLILREAQKIRGMDDPLALVQPSISAYGTPLFPKHSRFEELICLLLIFCLD